MVWAGEEEVMVYSGSWERDTMEGEGSMWWGDSGNIYSGQWARGQMHGRSDHFTLK